MFTKNDVLGVVDQLDLTNFNERYEQLEDSEGNLSGGVCRYATPDLTTPSCIVGHVVFHLDKQLFAQIADSGGTVQGESELLNAFDHDAIMWLADVQVYADGRDDNGEYVSWGQAIAQAEEALGES